MIRPFYTSLILITSLLVMSCTVPVLPFPQQIDLLQRYPIHTTKIERHQLAYLDVGQGPPVILLHGFGGSMWQWEQQQISLAQTHRVLTVDLLGSGLSDKPKISYSPALLITIIKQFMDNLHIQRASLVGNSLGAGIAIGMALSHPERVNKLVLISGFPANVMESTSSQSYRRFVEHPPPIWLARIGLWLAGRWATEQILKEIIFDHTLITSMLIERSYRNRADRGFLHPLYSQLDHLPDWENEYASRLTQISHQTLIIWGTEDRVFPASVGRTMSASIPNHTFLEVPNSGHIPQWENPQIINPALLQFLLGDE